VNLSHYLHSGRLGLLAAGALSPAEADAVRTHASRCPSCGLELGDLERAHKRLLEDAAIERPLPISSEALRTRVFAQIRAEGRSRVAPRAWGITQLAAAFGLVIAGVAVGFLWSKGGIAPSDPSRPAMEIADGGDAAMNAEFYERIEKSQTRANAARYLSEAQDVLIQVTAAADCPDSPKDSVDVTRESETSRSLLQRRAAIVSGSPEALVAARGVMEEVEGLLQEVADLPQCSRRSDVDAIARRVDRKKLLMKIDLMTQELAAP